MDELNEKLNCYRDIIEQILTEIAAYISAGKTYKDVVILDRKADSYIIIEEGWEGETRIHHIVIHLEIINGKVWLQADNTDLAVAHELERAGIPKSDIVLGLHPPHIRPLTDYAAA
jgi:XisI protein